MEFKLLFFYISVIFLVLRFNPYFPFGVAIMDYVGIYSIISVVYVTLFSIHVFIKNYEGIKEFILRGQSNATSFLVRKKEQNVRADFLTFLVISVTIAFCIDVIVTKISEQNLVTFIIELIPILQVIEDATPVSPVGNLNSTISYLNSPVLKIENLNFLIGLFFGPPLGALILFFLRQLRYRVRTTEKDPGARILLLFLIVTGFILISDIFYDVSNGFPSLKELSSFYFGFNGDGNPTMIDVENKVLLYGIGNVIQYAATFLINPYYYIVIIAIWVFDWYLFSKLWN